MWGEGAKSSRKRVISIKAANVTRFGVYRESIRSSVPFDKVVDVTSGYETENTICFLTVRHRQMGNVLLIWEPKEEILENIRQTVQVETIIKPVFNFKAAE